MLHELLSALFGNSGSIFRIEGRHIGVDTGLVLHPSERCVLDRLCRLASEYRTLDSFMKQNSRYLSCTRRDKIQESPLRTGIYLESFCMALDDTLKAYRNDLLALEIEILENRCVTATYIQSRLESYQVLLPALTSLIREIRETSSHGCQILDVIHRHSMSGIPMVHDAMKKILKAGHVTLLKQLQEWLLQGILCDKYEELFIKSQQIGNVQVTNAALTDFIQDHSVTLGQIVSDSYLTNPHQDTVYSLRAEMLPSYISVQLAEMILFIGVSVGLFKRKPGSSETSNKESTLGNQELEFSQKLSNLAEESEFNLKAFEEQLGVIKQALGKHLRNLMEKHGLNDHLKYIKDFYLLGRGELFLAFIDKADDYLRIPRAKCVISSIRAAFGESARSVLLDEEVLHHFDCNLNNQQVGQNQTDVNYFGTLKDNVTGWDCIELKYNPHWPLSILFTASVQERYNCILQFLLRVKRVQLQLHKCWTLQMPCNTRHHTKYLDDLNTRKLWHLRSCMTFIIDNLQYYLQVDVIESQHSVLMDKIKSMDFFDDIQMAHGFFLATVTAQTFISMKPVYQSLREVFNLCEAFCNLVEQIARAPRETISNEVEEYSNKFFLQTQLLLRILSSIRSHQASPHLGQLLTRIDFNKYFSNATSV